MAKKNTKHSNNPKSQISKKVESDSDITSTSLEKKEFKNKKAGKEPQTRQLVTYLFLAIAFVTTVSFFLYTVITSGDVIEQVSSIISSSILVLFSIAFLFVCLSVTSKKGQIFVIIASFLLTSFCGFQMLYQGGAFALPTQAYVESFTNKSLTEVIAWGQANHITIEQTYEASDTTPEYYIINQSVEPGTLLKDITSLKVTVSSGPDQSKEVIVPNMIGKTVDDVISFVEKNYFSNVTVDFAFSEEQRDLIIEQDKSGQLPRDEAIRFVASLGKEEDLVPVEMIDFTNKSEFYTVTWLKRYGISYTIEYDYSDTIKKGSVIRQSVETGTMVTPKQDQVVITISKGNKIEVPDLMGMDMESITSWIIEHKLKIEFTDQYDDTIPLGKPISVNYKQGDVLEEGAVVKVVISKGQLKMEKFSTPSEYREWAEKYQINYKEETEFSDSVPSGEIIRISHEAGQIIKNGDTIIITVSQGKQLTVPKLIGKTKSQAQKACNDAGIKCNFVYGGYSETVQKDVAIKQSKAEGSKIASESIVTVTLSKGIIEKVTVPNFTGQSQASIQGQCNNLGIRCNFVTESNFSSTPAGLATRQSASGKMNKGSTITVYISRGPAKSYTVNIQATWFGTTYNETVATLKAKLEKACPGVTFVFQPKDVNEGSGLISSDSSVKVGNNTFVQGQTYVITVNR